MQGLTDVLSELLIWACNDYVLQTEMSEVEEKARADLNFDVLEKELGKKFGDDKNPLLVSVRSGAAMSMPGMMNTILNLGLNDKATAGLAKATKNPVFEMLVGSIVNLVFNIKRKIENRDEQNATLERHLFQHKQVLESLKARDLKRAKEAMKKHILSTHKNIEESLKLATEEGANLNVESA